MTYLAWMLCFVAADLPYSLDKPETFHADWLVLHEWTPYTDKQHVATQADIAWYHTDEHGLPWKLHKRVCRSCSCRGKLTVKETPRPGYYRVQVELRQYDDEAKLTAEFRVFCNQVIRRKHEPEFYNFKEVEDDRE